MNEFELSKPEKQNYITVGNDKLEVTDDNQVNINGKRIESVEDVEQALCFIIKAICTLV